MGTHLIPREVEGEGRILIIFTMKGFIGTLIGIGIGSIFYTVFSSVGASVVGWLLLGLCALIGFIIGQVKVKKSNTLDIHKKTGKNNVTELIVTHFNFKKNRKIYTYEEGGKKK